MWHFMLGDFLVAALSEPDEYMATWVLYFNDKGSNDIFRDFETKELAEKFFYDHIPLNMLGLNLITLEKI